LGSHFAQEYQQGSKRCVREKRTERLRESPSGFIGIKGFGL
jgi:hypothetical protein